MTKEKKTKIMKVAIIFGVLILPLIYSIVYLGGFWDPYGNLDDIPVALVNEDDCEKDCKGQELVDQLTDAATFDYNIVSKEEAEEGLLDKTYYAIITIPSDFTDSFNKASTKERRQATITYSPNKKTSYLASQMINTALSKVEAKLESSVTSEVVDTLTDTLNEVPEQTKQIEDGLVTINNGTSKLNSGVATLKNGTTTLNTSYKAFDGGINELTSGLNTLSTNYKTLDDGINSLYDSVHNTLIPTVNGAVSNLSAGVAQLKTGSNTLNSKIVSGDYKNQMDNFMTTTSSVYSNLSTLCADENFKTNYSTYYASLCPAATGYNQTVISALKGSTDSIVDSTNDINNGINSLATNLSGMSSLTSGLNTLDESILKLKNGSTTVYQGINKLKDGAGTLSTSSNKISSGINTLDTSVSTLKSGTEELNNGVSSAKNQVSEKIKETENDLEQLNGLSDYASDSVKINEKDYGKVDKYGVFFAPYFISISLWVGGIIILIGIYYDPDNKFNLIGRFTKNRNARMLIYNVLGILQAIILAFVLKSSMGFDVTSNLLYYGTCILISISFLSIIMFLFFNFKDVGKFLAVVLLVLQLAASAGSFPIETEPAFYRTIFPFMPMKYSIELLRESLVNTDSAIITKNVLVLLGIFVVFGGLTLFTEYLKTKKEKQAVKQVKHSTKKVKA